MNPETDESFRAPKHLMQGPEVNGQDGPHGGLPGPRTTGDDANAIQDTTGNDAASVTIDIDNRSGQQPVAPDAPTGLSTTANGTTAIDPSWTAPADNGGRVISGYKVEVSTDSGATWTVLVATTGSTATSDPFSYVEVYSTTDDNGQRM